MKGYSSPPWKFEIEKDYLASPFTKNDFKHLQTRRLFPKFCLVWPGNFGEQTIQFSCSFSFSRWNHRCRGIANNFDWKYQMFRWFLITGAMKVLMGLSTGFIYCTIHIIMRDFLNIPQKRRKKNEGLDHRQQIGVNALVFFKPLHICTVPGPSSLRHRNVTLKPTG